MGCLPDPPSRDSGGPSRSLFVTDPHLHQQDDPDAVVARVQDYVDDLDADQFLSGGDVGEADHIDALMGVDAPMTRAVAGNHDAPYMEDVAADGGDLQYGEELAWEQDGYRIGMVHDPRDAALRATKDRFTRDPEDCYDIILHGHSHFPYSRVVETPGEDPLAVGGGGASSNYNVVDDLPDRSVHLIEIDGWDVTVQHHDFDTGDLVEEAHYRYAPGDGFTETAHWTVWDGDRYDGH